MPFIDLHHQAAAVQNQGTVFFFRQNTRLLFLIVVDHLPDFHAVLTGQVIIASNHVRTGLLGLSKKLFIKISRHPVITVNKTDPFPLSLSKPQVFGSPLFSVFRGSNDTELIRIFLFVFL